MIRDIFKKLILVTFCLLFCAGLKKGVFAVPEKTENKAAPEINYVDNETGVRFYAPEGVVPEGTHFEITQVIPGLNKEDNKDYRNIIRNLDEDKKKEVENLDLYRIDLVNEKNKKISPNGYIKVMLPVNKRFDESDIEVLKVVSGKDVVYENKITQINGIKYCVFETNNFSTYCLFDKLAPNQTIQKYVPYIIYTAVLLSAGILFFIIKGKRLK